MVIELTLGNVITVLALFVAAVWALMKVINAQHEKRLAERFDGLALTMQSIAQSQDSNAKATQELEREFHRHRAELAREYVRRDDFVRHAGTIETRIDNFALRMERALDQLGGKK